MNTEINGLLENIKILYDRKNNINALIDLLNKVEKPALESTYGLYAVPDDPTLFDECYSIHETNMPHIKLTGFLTYNNKFIPNVLEKINNLYSGNKIWELIDNKVNQDYSIKSSTLTTLSKFLTENEIVNASKLFFINCKKIPNRSTWSLTMVEKNGTNVKLVGDRIPLHDIINSTINVLSYNVNYEAMQGKHTKCGGKMDVNNKCLNNVSTFIKNKKPFDFIGLQEATNYEKIIEIAELTNMGYIYNKPIHGIEDMITLYNKEKYTLESHLTLIGGMSGPTNIIKPDARPFMMLFFREKICVFNMHSSHATKGFPHSFFNFNEYLKTQLKNHVYKSEIIEKLSGYEIILVGDLNNKITNDNTYLFLKDDELVPQGRLLYGVNKVYTCCDTRDLAPAVGYLKLMANQNKHITIADHILSTNKNIKTKVHNIINPGSDHLPITAIIEI